MLVSLASITDNPWSYETCRFLMLLLDFDNSESESERLSFIFSLDSAEFLKISLTWLYGLQALQVSLNSLERVTSRESRETLEFLNCTDSETSFLSADSPLFLKSCFCFQSRKDCLMNCFVDDLVSSSMLLLVTSGFLSLLIDLRMSFNLNLSFCESLLLLSLLLLLLVDSIILGVDLLACSESETSPCSFKLGSTCQRLSDFYFIGVSIFLLKFKFFYLLLSLVQTDSFVLSKILLRNLVSVLFEQLRLSECARSVSKTDEQMRDWWVVFFQASNRDFLQKNTLNL